MELNILKPDSNDYCEAVGITPQRQQELSKALDAMVRRLDSQPIQIVKMHDVFAEILSYCKNEAEAVYCTVLHCGLNARRGRILAPGPLNMDVIRLGLEMLYDRLRKEFHTEFAAKARESMGMLIMNNEEEVKEGARKGVQFLLDRNDIVLAKDIMNKLTGFAF